MSDAQCYRCEQSRIKECKRCSEQNDKQLQAEKARADKAEIKLAVAEHKTEEYRDERDCKSDGYKHVSRENIFFRRKVDELSKKNGQFEVRVTELVGALLKIYKINPDGYKAREIACEALAKAKEA